MDEKKKRLKSQDRICLFIFIDKAIHAASLQNSRITISISLHPSIYPVSSSPILVQFNHINFSFGLIIPFSTFLNGGIKSISDLKLQIIFRDSLTSRIIGKCNIPFNSKNDNQITQLEDTNHKSTEYELINFSQKIEDLPYFFHQSSKFPIFSQRHSKNSGSPNKVEICQIVLTVALGKESDKEMIMPTGVNSQEQIRFKRNYRPKSTYYSPPLSPDSNFKLQNEELNSPLSDVEHYSSKFSDSDKFQSEKDINFLEEKPKVRRKMSYEVNYKRISSSNNLKQRHLNIKDRNKFNLHINILNNSNRYQNKNQSFLNKNIQYKQDSSRNLTPDQIQYVIRNWEKYALQSGWSPPQIQDKKENKQFNVSSPTSQQATQPKFSGLYVRKLIKISPKGSSIVISNQYDSDNNRQESQNSEHSNKSSKNTDSESFDSFEIKDTKSSPITSISTSHNKKKKKNSTKFLNTSNDSEDKRPKKGQSVGPKRTTQYQLMNDLSLNDDFPDKVQKCFNSDPPPRFPVINEYESSSEDEKASPIGICDNDSDFEKTAMSSPGFLPIMSPTISNGEEFFSQNDSFEYQSSALLKKIQKSVKIDSPSSFTSLQAETESNEEIVNGLKSENNNETIEKEIKNLELEDRNKNKQVNSDEGNFDEITKSSFESLEAMIKVPPIQKTPHLKYSIVHFDNLFDSAPSINYGKKEIINVQVFRARPNPSEKLNTIYYMRSQSNQKKEKIPPPLPLKSLSEPQMPIIKSPSLEKIFQDGFMDSGLNISGIYNDSSSEG